MLKVLPGRSGSIRRFGAVAAAAAASALLLAGCAAGQDAQTVGQRPAIDGVSATSGDISVDAAAVLPPQVGTNYPKGGAALLQLTLTNNGQTPATLMSVSSNVAGTAVVSNAGVPGSASASDTSLPTASPAGTSSTGSGSTSAGPSATSSSSPATSGTPKTSSSAAKPSSSASAIPAPTNVPINLPPGQSVSVGYQTSGPNISLGDLNTTLFPAQTVQVTFTFGTGANGNTPLALTMNLPVQLTSDAPSAPVISQATEPLESDNN